MKDFHLQRFIDAQKYDYLTALSEIQSGHNAHIGCSIYFLKSLV